MLVMGGHLLHPELTADGSGVAGAHGLRVGDVDLDEGAGGHLWKTGPVPSLLGSAGCHQSPSFMSRADSRCDTADRTSNNCRSDNGQ